MTTKEMNIVVEVDIKQKFDFNLSAEHIKDLELALSQIPRVVEFLQISLSSGEKEVWEDLRQSGWGWIPPRNWDVDNWEYGLCWHFAGDYIGVTQG